MRRIPVDERRARLGVRHALAPGPRRGDVVDAARAVVGLHGTDPASTFLAALARTPGATHRRRRARAVRRPHPGAGSRDAAHAVRRAARARRHRAGRRRAPTSDASSARSSRRCSSSPRSPTIPARGSIAPRRRRWPRCDGAGEIISTELAAADPLLGTRVEIAPGTKYATTASVASRLLTLLSAEGQVVRTRPRGGWTSTQFRWATLDDWIGHVERPDTATASSEMAQAWLTVLRAGHRSTTCSGGPAGPRRAPGLHSRRSTPSRSTSTACPA